MKIIFPFFVLMMFSFAHGETQSEALAKIRALLVKHPQVKGHFEQIRTVKDLDLKLVSSGQFQFKLPLELNWNQKKPFILDLLMTPEKIIQTNADGSQQIITKEEQPVIFVFSASFLGIFSGDEKNIGQNFKFDVQKKGKKWNMDLEPKDETMKKLISSVKISGGEFVDKVQVLEKSGNSNTIRFSGVQGI